MTEPVKILVEVTQEACAGCGRVLRLKKPWVGWAENAFVGCSKCQVGTMLGTGRGITWEQMGNIVHTCIYLGIL